MFKIISLSALLLSVSTPAVCADYVQAPGSYLNFTGSYYDTSFKGTFPGFTTRFSFDPAHLADAALDVSILLAGATTRNADYDNQIHSTAFFSSKRFPQALYSSTKFRRLGGNRYAADGTLTLRGVSKPVTLTFTWSPAARPVLTGEAIVKREEFGVGSGALVDAGIIPSDIPNEIKVATRVMFKPQ